jgi:tricorn protease
MRKFSASLVLLPLCLAAAGVPAAGVPVAQDPPLLLRFPTISRTQIVFNYAGDLWIVGREGGEARQLTSGVGTETAPHFSPDGSTIAFTGEYDGNRDVYIVPAGGGVPKRLTFHPAEELVRGWTPDGAQVLFSSNGNSFRGSASQLYTVSLTGGLPTQLPLPTGEEASFAPDGQHLAYVPHMQWQEAWKRYRGGQTTPIWLADLRDSSIVKVPRSGSNDHYPMWVGGTLYFLSDRDGPVSLYAYDVKSGRVSEALRSDGLDFKSAQATTDAIIIEQFGGLKLYDLATHQAREVPVRVRADIAAVRPHYIKVEPRSVQSFNLSPTGARAVFEAWGEIFTVPAQKGDIRNITRSPAVADRNPAWSPDGRWIAYFSDASGEYELTIRDQAGLAPPRHISLGSAPSFFYDPVWSPDSKKIAYADKHLGLWYVDLDTQARQRIDEDYYGGFDPPAFSHGWSPDGEWITYARQLESGLHAVFLYSLARGKTYQVTDGMSDARFPAFDRSGKYLYFTASTDVALTTQRLDMSSNEHPVTRSLYLVVLSKDEPSPLAPESDEEVAPAPEGGHPAAQTSRAPVAQHENNAAPRPAPVRIDIEGIGQRILSMPIPAGNYVSLKSAKAGVLLLGEGPMVARQQPDGTVLQSVERFDLINRKLEKLADGVNAFTVSFDGRRLLYRHGHEWLTAPADEPPSPGGAGAAKAGPDALKLDDWQVYIEPRPMWQQIYDETWRIERDFFYDPHYHGLDLAKARKKYAPYLAGIASREELTYLFNEALGELTVGHVFVSGGEQPEVKKVKVGLLGADYAVENGRYRIARVYGGESWNPSLRAPLTQPGVNVRAGEYLLAVNSRELRSTDNVYAFFQGLAGREVVLRVGPRPDGETAREVTVVPVEDEQGLRHYAWIEANRRTVEQATGGRVAYVYVPNTSHDGFTSFNRYFFSQVGKQGAIIDERFNEGGQLADYIIDYLRRPLLSRVVSREGHDWSTPSQAIYGPKAMIINEMSGSGGDALPWYFRKSAIGPLIGKRTWGGLVGIGGYPLLIDGGRVTAPRAAVYGLDGQWEVENHGVEPDVDVDLDPQLYRKGHDSQLDRAIQVVLQQLKEHPAPVYARPSYPNYHLHDDLGAGPPAQAQR